MVAVSADPNYQRLAATAAASIGARSPEITKAILAQWQCEQDSGWPPARNNPGNLARGAADVTGVPYGIAPGRNPQPSNPIVTFGSPEAGAEAYARLIARGARYGAARRAAANGDGLGYLREVSSAGYGTRYGCASSVYRSIAGRDTDPLGTRPPSAPAAGESANLIDLLPPSIRPAGTSTPELLAARDRYKSALAAAGISTADDYRLTQADADKLAAAWRWPAAARLKGTINGLVYQALGQPNSFAPAFTEAANQNIADALTGLADSLKETLARVVFVGAIVGLVIIGLVKLFGGDGES